MYKRLAYVAIALSALLLLYCGCVQQNNTTSTTALEETTLTTPQATEPTTELSEETVPVPEAKGLPDGASCTMNPDCSSQYCTGNVCCRPGQCGKDGVCYDDRAHVGDCQCTGWEIKCPGNEETTSTAETTPEEPSTSYETTTSMQETSTSTTAPDESPVVTDISGRRIITTPEGISFYETVLTYWNIDEITQVNGKLVYSGNIGDHSYIVYDGVEVPGVDKYVIDIEDIGGKLAYLAHKSGPEEEYSIVYDGKEINPGYDEIGMIVDVGGKLAYTAYVYKPPKIIIVYDGKEVGTEYGDRYHPADFNGRLAYVAVKDGKAFIVYEGKKITPEYDGITSITEINGKLAYVAKQGDKYFVVYDGTESSRYGEIMGLKDWNGKIAYLAGNDFSHLTLVFDGKEYPVDGLYYTIVNGKPAYPSGGFIAYDGKEIHCPYKECDMDVLYGFNGKLICGMEINHTAKTVLLEEV